MEGNLPEPSAEEVPHGAPHGSNYGPTNAMGPYAGPYAGGPDGDWQGGDGYEGGYDDSCCGDCNCCCDGGNRYWENLSLFAGAQGFKGPPDNGNNGNFGFHQGINWAFPLCDCYGIGFQLGGEITESSFTGGGDHSSARIQEFMTTGFFHRAMCGQGCQGGVVLDYFHDGWTDASLLQLRPELSYLFGCCNEIGFMGAIGLNSQSSTGLNTRIEQFQTTDWRPNNWYAAFYRRQFCNTATARLWAGVTNQGEALVGADASAPLTQTVSLFGGFNYAVPKSDYPGGPREESFGVVVSLVWHLGYKGPCSPCNPYRPLFNVADNNTFLIDQSITTHQVTTVPPLQSGGLQP